jgi:tetratricopeptide (TPR) repeat protein
MYKKALEAHQKVPLYSTNPGMILRNMGYALTQMSRYEEALDAYKHCLR